MSIITTILKILSSLLEDQKETGKSNPCSLWPKLIWQNIKLLETLHEEKKLEYLSALPSIRFLVEHLHNYISKENIYNYHPLVYIGIAQLLPFWNKNFPIVTLLALNPDLFGKFVLLPKKTHNYSYTSNLSTNPIITMVVLKILETSIGKAPSGTVLQIYKVLNAIRNKDVSLLADNKIITTTALKKETASFFHDDNGLDEQAWNLFMNPFYKDALQTYHWNEMFYEMSGLISRPLFNAICQYHNTEEWSYSNYYCVRKQMESASEIASNVVDMTWTEKNNNASNQLAYAIVYAILLYRNTLDGTTSVIKERITSATCEKFDSLWEQIKEYTHYKSKCGLDSESLARNTVFQKIKTLDEAIEYLKHIYNCKTDLRETDVPNSRDNVIKTSPHLDTEKVNEDSGQHSDLNLKPYDNTLRPNPPSTEISEDVIFNRLKDHLCLVYGEDQIKAGNSFRNNHLIKVINVARNLNDRYAVYGFACILFLSKYFDWNGSAFNKDFVADIADIFEIDSRLMEGNSYNFSKSKDKAIQILKKQDNLNTLLDDKGQKKLRE